MKIKKIQALRFLTRFIYLAIFITGAISHNYVMIFIAITTVLLGSIFCGWMCFLGLYQDILRYIGRFIKKRPIEFNDKIHGILKYLRYIILIASITIGGIFLFPGEVWGNFASIIKGHIKVDYAFYFLIILGVFSLFAQRFFCRYLCSFGAKLGLLSLIRPITLNKDKGCCSAYEHPDKKESCKTCKLCSESCPMHIEIHKAKSLASPNCINCLTCLDRCPHGYIKIGLRSYLKS